MFYKEIWNLVLKEVKCYNNFFFKEFYFNLFYLCRKYLEYYENFLRFFVFVIIKVYKGIYNLNLFNWKKYKGVMIMIINR